MIKRIVTAAAVLLFAGILVSLSAGELQGISGDDSGARPIIFLGK